MTSGTSPLKNGNGRSETVAVCAGTALILIGCCQLVYSSLALLSMFAIAGFELVWMLIRALFSIGPEERAVDLSPTEAGTAAIDLASTVVSLGPVMVGAAIVGGILLLRGKRQALYMVVVVTLCAFGLSIIHLTAAFYLPAAIYVIIGILGSLYVIKNRRTPSSSAPITPS